MYTSSNADEGIGDDNEDDDDNDDDENDSSLNLSFLDWVLNKDQVWRWSKSEFFLFQTKSKFEEEEKWADIVFLLLNIVF